MPENADIEVTLMRLLDEHSGWKTVGPEFRPADRLRWHCICGEKLDDDPSGVNILARHRAHVATVLASDWLAERLAQAWDEGWQKGYDDAVTYERGATNPEDRPRNPYRIPPASTEEADRA